MAATNNLRGLLERKAHGLFMAHMIAGFPSAETSVQIAHALARGGADIIELQIPFSDPMADGPTIAGACSDALKKGMTVTKSIAVLRRVAKLGKPVVVMSYINPAFRYGISRFVKIAREAGASALIVPDCPFDSEEGVLLLEACKKNDLCLIPVVSPDIPKARLERLAKDSSGFVYCTSRQGVTGANSKFAHSLFGSVREMKEVFRLPVAVGFGVRSAADVRRLSRMADMVIAGSAFVQAVRAGASVERVLKDLLRC